MTDEEAVRAAWTDAEVPQLPEGCGYQGYEFGAGRYPDSICFGGRLYDADDCDESGNYYEPTEDIPCPMCRRKDAIEYWANRNQLGGLAGGKVARKAARMMIDDIRRNREKGTEPWNNIAEAGNAALKETDSGN